MFLHPSDMAGEEINSHLCAKYTVCLLANASKLHQHTKLVPSYLFVEIQSITIQPHYSRDRGKCLKKKSQGRTHPWVQTSESLRYYRFQSNRIAKEIKSSGNRCRVADPTRHKVSLPILDQLFATEVLSHLFLQKKKKRTRVAVI